MQLACSPAARASVRKVAPKGPVQVLVSGSLGAVDPEPSLEPGQGQQFVFAPDSRRHRGFDAALKGRHPRLNLA